jgi:gliding motility-associated-like protein
MRTLLIFLLICIAAVSYAQVPVIQKVEPLNTFPGDTIFITGNGFNNTPSNLEVWFEGVKGTIVSSSEYSIEVVVPAQARFGPVQVINLASKLSGRSGEKFTPSMPIAGFDAAKFTTVRTITAPEEFWDLCYCDLNNDGKQDIATTKFKRTSPFPTPTDIMILQNTSTPGNIDFVRKDKSNTTFLNPGFSTDNVVCGDLQGDGKADLVVTRGTTGSRNSLHIYRNITTGTDITLAAPISLFMDVGHFATRMAIRDLNKDGKPEIIATNSFNDVFYIYINTSASGNLSFSSTPLKMSIKLAEGESLTTYETDVQDFDGDNLPDIIINQFQTNNFYILKNQSAGSVSFGTAQKFTLTGALNRLVSADLNNDGLLDAVFTNTLNDNAYVLINQSTTSAFAFSAPIVLTTSFEPWGVEVGDIDGDSDIDILINNRNRPVPVTAQLLINVFRNNGGATPTFTRSDIPLSTPGRNIRIGDLDGDSKPDIAITEFNESVSPASSQVRVLENSNCFQPSILNVAPLSICTGQTIRLETIPAANVTFAWKESGTPVGSNLPYLDITAPGTYTVTATGEGGLCVATSAALVVSVNAAATPPKPTIVHDAPVCKGSVLHLSTTAVGTAYAWTGPGGKTYSTQNPSITVSAEDAGQYTLQITAGGCKSPEAKEIIDVVDLSDFTISTNSTSSPICSGTAVTLSVNNLQNYGFQWEKNNASIAGATTATLNATEAGAYTVVVTPPSGLNCPVIETAAFNAAFVTAPVASFNVPATACVNLPVTFTNTSTVDPTATVIYSWAFGDTQTSTDTSPIHTYSSATAVTASLTVRYQGVTGCQNSSSKNITITNAVQPVINSTVASACPDDEVTLSLNTTFPSVTWSTSATSSTIVVNPGDFSVQTIDANGCPGTDTHTVAAKEAPDLIATATPDVMPAGASSQLTASGASTYLWQPGATLSDSTISSPTAEPVQTTTYTLTGTSADGCTATLQLTITIEGVLGFPIAFSPNGDGQNEIWDIQAEFNTECTVAVFDGRGRKVFEGSGENWDGTYQGKEVPQGTYYYVYTCPGESPRTGSILLFR